MDLYFDSSVYGLIDALNEAKTVRRWLRAERHRLIASDEANIGEVLRIPDSAARTRLVETIFRSGARPSPRPADLAGAEELLSELMRIKPEWVRTYPGLRSKADYMRHRRRTVWDELRADPWYLPPASIQVMPALEGVIGDNLTAQKARRQAVQQGASMNFVARNRPDLTALMTGYPELERYIRYQLCVDWWSMFENPKSASAELDSLAPHLDFEEMFRNPQGPWLEFWFRELDPDRMPSSVASVLVEKHQEKYRVTAGNTIDRIHGAYLQLADRIVTADRDFYNIMLCVVGDMKTRGVPILVDRGAASAVAELRRTIQ
jgi:hypothetical protein